MNEEKDFLKTCFNTVAGLEVKNESQAIAKEVVLSEVENLQQENKKLKDIWNKLIKQVIDRFNKSQNVQFLDVLQDMQELEQGSDSK